MTRITVSETLFGESTLFFYNPIKKQQQQRTCSNNEVEQTKILITQETILVITNLLYQDRTQTYDYRQKYNPHHVTKEFRRAILSLREQVARMQQFDDLTRLAQHVSTNIMPDLLSENVRPRKDANETNRYNQLITDLENIISGILFSELYKTNAKTSSEKAANFAF